MTDSLTVNFKDVSVQSNMTFEPPKEKDVPIKPGMAPGSGGKYKEINLQYNYGDATKPESARVSDFLMEWPELYSSSGLVEKPGLSGKNEFTLMSNLPAAGDTGVVAQKMKDVHAGCAAILNQFKGAVGLPLFNATMAEATGFKCPISYMRDKVSGELLQGRDPSVFLKCFKRGPVKTLFHRPIIKVDPKTREPIIDPTTGKPAIDYQEIDWNIVKGAEMRYIPLIHIKKIYIGGGKASLQMEVVSAIVTYLVARGSNSKQTATLKNLVEKDPKLLDNLEEQIAKLMALRQDLLNQNGVGGAPQTRQAVATQAPAAADGAQTTNANMQDFLAANGGGNMNQPIPPPASPVTAIKMPALQFK